MANSVHDYFREMCNHFAFRDLLHTFGDDFTYANARMVYKNMDYLFDYINENQDKFNMQVNYSTPEDYINQIYSNSH